jgi:hypothetical protein
MRSIALPVHLRSEQPLRSKQPITLQFTTSLLRALEPRPVHSDQVGPGRVFLSFTPLAANAIPSSSRRCNAQSSSLPWPFSPTESRVLQAQLTVLELAPAIILRGTPGHFRGGGNADSGIDHHDFGYIASVFFHVGCFRDSATD